MDASKLIGFDGYFATRLRALMKEKRVTQQDLAASVGTTRQAISQYADGSVQPNIEKLYKIAEFFKVSADYLLGISDNSNPDINMREVSRLTGLTENSLEKLKHDAYKICCIGKSNLPGVALTNLLNKYGDSCTLLMPNLTPSFHVINLLLSDTVELPSNYETILRTMGKILAFKREPLNQNIYGLFHFKNNPDSNKLQTMSPEELFKLSKEEFDNLIEAQNRYDDNEQYYLLHNSIFDLLLVELQGTIKRYKDENNQ